MSSQVEVQRFVVLTDLKALINKENMKNFIKQTFLKLLPAFGVVLLFGVVAISEDDVDINFIIGNGRYLGAKTVDSQTTIPVLGVDASGNTQVNSLSGKSVSLAVAKTPAVSFDADSLDPVQDVVFPAAKMVVYPVPAVITPATSYPTPAAGTLLTEKVTLIATAGPTAQFVELARATPVSGSKEYVLINESANPVQMVPRQGSSVNALAAGTPYACTTGKECSCRRVGADRYWCSSK